MNFLLPLIDLGLTVEPGIFVIVIQYGGNAPLLQERLEMVANDGFGNR